MTTERPTDDMLWYALTQGDRDAFSELYHRYHRSLYSYGYRLFPQAASVEDAIQDLFVDLWQMRQRLSAAECVKFYLFRSLRRHLYRLSEREKRSYDSSIFPLSHQADRPVDQILIDQEKAEQLTQRLTHLLQQLPQRQLEVVTLRYYENFRTHDIADIMGITDKSVRNTLHKALSQLREHSHHLAPALELLLLGLLAWL